MVRSVEELKHGSSKSKEMRVGRQDGSEGRRRFGRHLSTCQCMAQTCASVSNRKDNLSHVVSIEVRRARPEVLDFQLHEKSLVFETAICRVAPKSACVFGAVLFVNRPSQQEHDRFILLCGGQFFEKNGDGTRVVSYRNPIRIRGKTLHYFG